jgi:hypothetical protein
MWYFDIDFRSRNTDGFPASILNARKRETSFSFLFYRSVVKMVLIVQWTSCILFHHLIRTNALYSTRGGLIPLTKVRITEGSYALVK